MIRLLAFASLLNDLFKKNTLIKEDFILSYELRIPNVSLSNTYDKVRVFNTRC